MQFSLSVSSGVPPMSLVKGLVKSGVTCHRRAVSVEDQKIRIKCGFVTGRVLDKASPHVGSFKTRLFFGRISGVRRAPKLRLLEFLKHFVEFFPKSLEFFPDLEVFLENRLSFFKLPGVFCKIDLVF